MWLLKHNGEHPPRARPLRPNRPVRGPQPRRGDSLQTRSVTSHHKSGCSGGEGTDQEKHERAFWNDENLRGGLWGIGVVYLPTIYYTLMIYIAQYGSHIDYKQRSIGMLLIAGWLCVGVGAPRSSTSCSMVL